MNKQFPITITEAKRIARLRLGRLPRVGYSVVVGGMFTGMLPSRRWDYQLSLENYKGDYVLTAWERPFITTDFNDFQSIEHEKDSRH